MTDQAPKEKQPDDPQQALIQIRQRLNAITREYSAGNLNNVQFQALYRHYMEKRMVIEKLVERDPDTDAWQAAASEGNTGYLRDKYEARPLYYVVFREGEKRPLMAEGKLPQKAAEQLHKLLKIFWMMKTWRQGLARKAVGDGVWMLLMVGNNALTITVYFLQPSTIQTNQMRDLHTDFERANKQALERKLPAERMVFPQRALMDK